MVKEHKKQTMARHVHNARKRYQYPAKTGSLQQQLIERAILIGERKDIKFSGDGAIWLSETAETTAQAVMSSFQIGPIAFNDRVIKAIDEAFAAIRKLVEAIASGAGKGASLNAERCNNILQGLCPLPPIC